MNHFKGKLAGVSIVMTLALAMMACSLVDRLTTTRTPLPSTLDFSTAEPRPHPQIKGLSMGDPKALVSVTAYGDFQCPSCRNYVLTMEPGIINQFIVTGQANYTFLPFSFLDEANGAVGSESHHAAEAAYCASDQGKFWEYHDTLYTNQASENSGGFSDDKLTGMAQLIGLNMTKFNQCYSSHRYQQQVKADEKSSLQAGVNSVPTFSVDGKFVYANDLAGAITAAYKAKGGQ